MNTKPHNSYDVLKNLVVIKTRIPNEVKEQQLEHEFEIMIKQQLAIKLALEFLVDKVDMTKKKIDMEYIGSDFKISENDTEYSMEAYLFTKEDLKRFVADIKTKD